MSLVDTTKKPIEYWRAVLILKIATRTWPALARTVLPHCLMRLFGYQNKRREQCLFCVKRDYRMSKHCRFGNRSNFVGLWVIVKCLSFVISRFWSLLSLFDCYCLMFNKEPLFCNIKFTCLHLSAIVIVWFEWKLMYVLFIWQDRLLYIYRRFWTIARPWCLTETIINARIVLRRLACVPRLVPPHRAYNGRRRSTCCGRIDRSRVVRWRWLGVD